MPRVVLVERERMAKVRERAAPAADSFVYGVRSTGIYCRPDCPSRRPAPEQVVFFDSPREAVASGFRACRRCHPERGLSYSEPLEAVERACRMLDASTSGPMSLASVARTVGYSPAHFQRIFTELLGVSPKQYHDAARARRFREELREGRSVRRAVYAAGHRSLSWPYSGSSIDLGMEPGEYRRGGAGAVIGYMTAASRLGRLIVAATPRGISYVGFGESDESLERRLTAEFPRATTRRVSGAPIAGWVEQIGRSLDGGRLPLTDLPLDLRATTFQARVWNAIRSIGRGSTRTYGEIAREIGSPSSARAVAGACADNPTALLIPCHRVIRGDQALGGYRWGLPRKRELLASEAEPPSRSGTEPAGDP